MIATPLAKRGGAARVVFADAVVGGLGVTALAASARRSGRGRAAAAALVTAAATLGVEQLGSRTGVPFGRYAYTRRLQPQVAGVPAAVPVAWFGMAVPAREAAHALLGPGARPAAHVALGAALLTAWDLFLDPQMTAEGYWQWARVGAYRGIPLGNYAGWFATGVGVMALLDIALPANGDAEADVVPVAVYALVAVMSTLGFAAFFRDRTVATVGGVAMVPPAIAALAALVRRGRGASRG